MPSEEVQAEGVSDAREEALVQAVGSWVEEDAQAISWAGEPSARPDSAEVARRRSLTRWEVAEEATVHRKAHLHPSVIGLRSLVALPYPDHLEDRLRRQVYLELLRRRTLLDQVHQRALGRTEDELQTSRHHLAGPVPPGRHWDLLPILHDLESHSDRPNLRFAAAAEREKAEVSREERRWTTDGADGVASPGALDGTASSIRTSLKVLPTNAVVAAGEMKGAEESPGDAGEVEVHPIYHWEVDEGRSILAAVEAGGFLALAVPLHSTTKQNHPSKSEEVHRGEARLHSWGTAKPRMKMEREGVGRSGVMDLEGTVAAEVELDIHFEEARRRSALRSGTAAHLDRTAASVAAPAAGAPRW